MNNFTEIANFIWTIAELLRDDFDRSKYQDIVLPLTVLRRIECVLEPTKEEVLKTYAHLKGKLDNLDPQRRRASCYAFYNTSPFNFERLLDDAPQLGSNLRLYINSISPNMREVLEKFDFEKPSPNWRKPGTPNPTLTCVTRKAYPTTKRSRFISNVKSGRMCQMPELMNLRATISMARWAKLAMR